MQARFWITAATLSLALGACCVCNDEPDEGDLVKHNNEAEYKRWFAHHPAWARDESAGHVAPQPPSARALYAEIKPREGALTGALLVCDFAITKKSSWDPFGDPDPALDLSRNDGIIRTAYYGDGHYKGAVSWPQVDLQPGDKLKLRMIDVDLSHHDGVGVAELTWDGKLPLTFADENFEARCGALDAAQVEVHLPEASDALEGALKALDAALVPSPGKEHWGYPSAEVNEARARLKEWAGLLGWSDARVKEQVGRHDELLARWGRDVERSLKEELEKLPGTDAAVELSGGLKVRVAEARCDQTQKARAAGLEPRDRARLKDNPCYVLLKVKNEGQEPLSLTLRDWPAHMSLYFVMKDGGDKPLRAFSATGADGRGERSYLNPGKAQGEFELAAGAEMTLALEPERGEVNLEDARLLRAREGGTTKLLRIREGGL